MKNFSEILDIEKTLNLNFKIKIIDDNGYPDFQINLNNESIDFLKEKYIIISKKIPLLEKLNIEIKLKNKKYSDQKETAVIVESISIENISIIPDFNHLINYENDHNENITTNYIGYNGIWNLNIDEPFFQWYHRVSGQGILIR
jgi:hypothetical protein